MSPKSNGRRTKKASTETVDSQLVVYVHGIGNKPRESVLKCQWGCRT